MIDLIYLCMIKRKREIILIEIGITDLDLLTQVENDKIIKYDLVANVLSLMYKCKVNIIPYVLTWDGLVTKYHKKHSNEIGVPAVVEAYIQSIVLKKTLESISFERRRGVEEEDKYEEIENIVGRIVGNNKGVEPITTQ